MNNSKIIRRLRIDKTTYKKISGRYHSIQKACKLASKIHSSNDNLPDIYFVCAEKDRVEASEQIIKHLRVEYGLTDFTIKKPQKFKAPLEARLLVQSMYNVQNAKVPDIAAAVRLSETMASRFCVEDPSRFPELFEGVANSGDSVTLNGTLEVSIEQRRRIAKQLGGEGVASINQVRDWLYEEAKESLQKI